MMEYQMEIDLSKCWISFYCTSTNQ